MEYQNQLICICNNKCPKCCKDNLSWNLFYSSSDMELFRCGHGLCKDCYHLIKDDFLCPVCGDMGQLQNSSNGHLELQNCKTFHEWYGDYGIYIESGAGQNIIRYTSFGKQLLRLIKAAKKTGHKKVQKNNKKKQTI